MYPDLTPTQFLIHQIFNSRFIQHCFNELLEHSYEKLAWIRNELINFQCYFCVDEAHVLVEHLGETIITSTDGNHVQQNGDVNEDARRGTLSVLLYAIKDTQIAKKVIFAGTSNKLRNIDNFGTYETKPVRPTVLKNFSAWDNQMAVRYVSNLINIDSELLENVLTDNYRPRILENFVYDLFCIGMNDTDSPTSTKNRRVGNRINLTNMDDIIVESYRAVLHRFTRVSIEPLAKIIRENLQTEIILKLLLTSMMTSNHNPINCHLNENQISFFENTVGAIYLISDFVGHSFFEGYVIESLLSEFKEEIVQFNLLSSLNLLKDIVRSEGKKSSAKGVSFEAVVLSDIKQNEKNLSEILRKFGVTIDVNQKLSLPTKEVKMDDETIIQKRPVNVFVRPSNMFRPDIIAFLSEKVCLSFGIKLYTSRIPEKVHNDNLESTDPKLFFSKAGKITNTANHSKWQASLRDKPLALSIRFLIEMPGPVNSISMENVIEKSDVDESITVTVSSHNMRILLGEEVCKLIEFITS